MVGQFRRGLAGHLLPRHKGQGLVHGCAHPLDEPAQALDLQIGFQGGVEVGLHPLHGVGADGLDPGLLQRIPGGLSLGR